MHRSPFCKSPTEQGRLKLCHAQSMVPAPVAASPHKTLVSARFTALWLEHKLVCTQLYLVPRINKMMDLPPGQLILVNWWNFCMPVPLQKKHIHDWDQDQQWPKRHYGKPDENWRQCPEIRHIEIWICVSAKSEGKDVNCTYHISDGAFSHPSGRFFPTWGHAGHKTAHAPGSVPAIPLGWWPWSACCICLMNRHSRIMHNVDS